MTNLILCGGSGTRLFPLSRTNFPKQFLQIFPKSPQESAMQESTEQKISLFTKTYLRNAQICKQTLIISNTEQYFLANDQLESCQIAQKPQYILESLGKNTAPAVILACLTLPKDEIVLVTPSDHLIKDEESYFQCVKKAKKLARNGALVTFGITPNAPHTGYGYICADKDNVLGFYEKPTLAQAQKYLKSKNYLWNAGIFCFKVESLLKEAQLYAKEIVKACTKAIKQAQTYENVCKIPLKAMQEIPENSLDYAILEHSKNLKVVASDFAWSDVGSFDSLACEFPKDVHGNCFVGHVEALESKDNFAFCENPKKVIALIGTENLLVVETQDALLVAKKGQSQDIKQIVQKLSNSAFKEICQNHTTTYRPWGSYTVLENEQGYKIKRIVVLPNKRLSLQKHFHRNEHWIVLSGSATVEVDGEKKLLRPNESTYIKMGQTHRLSNEGKIPVVLIEAQVGEYTQEDDIVRIEDDFKRNEL